MVTGICKKLIEHDPQLGDVLNRYRITLVEIIRLKENRAIAADTADDTRSYDVNIEILQTMLSEQAYALNWGCKELGLPPQFRYEVCD